MTEHPDRLLSSVVSAMADCVAEVERLRAALKDMLDLHIAHHNHPTHAAARAALAPKEPSE